MVKTVLLNLVLAEDDCCVFVHLRLFNQYCILLNLLKSLDTLLKLKPLK